MDVVTVINIAAALITALIAIFSARPFFSSLIEKNREKAQAFREQRTQQMLTRHATTYGWAGSGSLGEVHAVRLVVDEVEMQKAVTELTANKVTDYVIIQETQNLGQQLRQMIERDGFVSRPPTPGEVEILHKETQGLYAEDCKTRFSVFGRLK